MTFIQKDHYGMEDLLSIMELLRSPEGCPWDQVQTHESIRINMLEEAYEAVEAIDEHNTELLKEELGDVLLQVVFHSQMEKERDIFDFHDVCDGICKKLIVRHPHIFSDTVAETSEEVLRNWDEIKQREKKQETITETLRSVPTVLPALMRAAKVQSRAAKTGFDYSRTSEAFSDLRSEVEELKQAIDSGDSDAIMEELGDLLFSAVNVARFVKKDPEQSLGKSCDKFIRRFELVEKLAIERNIDMKQSDLTLLDILWKEAKNKEY